MVGTGGFPNRSLSRTFHLELVAKITAKSFIEIKKKSPGFPSKKKLRVHLKQGDQINHETGKWIFKEWRVDKDISPASYFDW